MTLVISICRIYQIQSSLRNFRTVSVPTGFFPSFSFSLAMPSFLAISLICGIYFFRFLKENFGGGLYTLGLIMVSNSLKQEKNICLKKNQIFLNCFLSLGLISLSAAQECIRNNLEKSAQGYVCFCK